MSADMIVAVGRGGLSVINLLATPPWKSLGPNPILMPTGSATGAIQTVIGKRQGGTDGFDLFVGSVNGGVWRCQNFVGSMLEARVTGARGILWAPITDQAASLSAASIALDPTDPTGNTLWVGTGQFSSSQLGGPAVGLLKTVHAKAQVPGWTTLGGVPLHPGDVGLAGQRVIAVVPTTLIDPATGLHVVLVAAYDGQGLLRSADGGASFQTVQGPAGPLTGFATDLIPDPNHTETYYAALRATYGGHNNLTNAGGIFRSTDGGRHWAAIDNGIPLANRSKSLKLGVFDNARGTVGRASSTVLYAGQG
jgi:hypothetical protein